MQIVSQLYAEVPVERRLFKRVSSNFKASAGRESMTMQKVTVHDISPGGFKIDGWQGLEQGMSVMIELKPLHRLRAKVIWILGRRAGCEFTNQLTKPEFNRVVAANVTNTGPERAVFGRKKS